MVSLTITDFSYRLEKVSKRVMKVRFGVDTETSTRNACAPQNFAFELQRNALLKRFGDGLGLVRYVQSPDRLHEFISRNTASTRSR